MIPKSQKRLMRAMEFHALLIRVFPTLRPYIRSAYSCVN